MNTSSHAPLSGNIPSFSWTEKNHKATSLYKGLILRMESGICSKSTAATSSLLEHNTLL
jgi:hypothetical protein